ncbi:MAG: alcohol dehydrogenase catalytic domain-containing protein [bacterium]
MKALVFKDSLQLTEVPPPVSKNGDALVKVKMAGICNTDLELIRGYMGFQGILGHEFVGVVERAQNPDWVGKRVCGEINFGCGECDFCKCGMNRHCPNRTVLGILGQDGAFAEHVVLPVANLHEIPDSIPNSAAVFVEPVAAAAEILEQIQIEPNSQIAVIGDGKLGLLICQVLKLTGARIALVGKHERKLRLAETWGVERVKLDEIEGLRFDTVVEASGSPGGFSTAMQIVRPRGTVVLKSTYQGNLDLNAAPIVIDEITIVGSRCGPFSAAIRLLQQNFLTVEKLIDKIYPFSLALAALEHAKQHDSLKILLDFNE